MNLTFRNIAPSFTDVSFYSQVPSLEQAARMAGAQNRDEAYNQKRATHMAKNRPQQGAPSGRLTARSNHTHRSHRSHRSNGSGRSNGSVGSWRDYQARQKDSGKNLSPAQKLSMITEDQREFEPRHHEEPDLSSLAYSGNHAPSNRKEPAHGRRSHPGSNPQSGANTPMLHGVDRRFSADGPYLGGGGGERKNEAVGYMETKQNQNGRSRRSTQPILVP